MSDTIDPLGMRLTNYLKNPVVLAFHDSRSLPVGIGTSLDVSADGINAHWRWVKNDPFADRVRNVFEQGVLAASVGVRPLKWAPNEHGGLHFSETELLEFSLVPVPANADCTRVMRKSGLDRPALLARAALLVESLGTQMKEGRVLSGKNEDRMRQAVGLLMDVLSQLDDDDDDQPEKSILVLADDGTSRRITDEQLTKAARAAIPVLTVRDDDPPDAPVLRLGEDGITQADLIALIKGITHAVADGALESIEKTVRKMR